MSKFIVTLPGYDVDDAEPYQCAVHSDYPIMKMEPKNYGQLDYTFPDNPASGTTRNLLTINHGYNYVPASMGFIGLSGGPIAEPFFVQLRYLMTGFVQDFYCYANDREFKIDYSVYDVPALDVTGMKVQMKYYIFCEEGN
jgi:hypothetical protein